MVGTEAEVDALENVEELDVAVAAERVALIFRITVVQDYVILDLWSVFAFSDRLGQGLERYHVL